ncbi:MAG: hypothetical protein Q8K36_04750, partial [Alphaproteobacteria bacterium]|nr:hypothetical protein [Alphaproteobacteria bacterium]
MNEVDLATGALNLSGGTITANKTTAGDKDNVLNKLTISGGTLTAQNEGGAGNITNTINGTVSGGVLNLSRPESAVGVQNNNINNANLTVTGGTVNMDGATNTVVAGHTLRVNGGTVTMKGAANTIHGNLTVTQGVFNLDDSTLNIANAGGAAVDPVLTLNGGEVYARKFAGGAGVATIPVAFTVNGSKVDLSNHADEGTARIDFTQNVAVNNGSLDISNHNELSDMVVNVGAVAPANQRDLTVGANGKLIVGGKKSATTFTNDLAVNGEVQFRHNNGDFGTFTVTRNLVIHDGAKITILDDASLFAQGSTAVVSDDAVNLPFPSIRGNNATTFNPSAVKVVNTAAFTREYGALSRDGNRLQVGTTAAQVAEVSDTLVDDLSDMAGNVMAAQSAGSATQFGFTQNNAMKAKRQQTMRTILQQRLRSDDKLNAVMQNLAEN